MGREETANLESAALRRAAFDETVRRVGELEERLGIQKQIVNNQGRALQAIAEVITAMKAENEARDVMILKLSLRFWQRWYLAIAGYLATLRAAGVAAMAPAPASNVIPFADPAAESSCDLTADNPGVPDISEAPPAAQWAAAREAASRAPGAPGHIHQYEKDGPFLYACTVPECGKRSTLEEIANEAEYLASLDQKANA